MKAAVSAILSPQDYHKFGSEVQEIGQGFRMQLVEDEH
jgi:hypothetical protein